MRIVVDTNIIVAACLGTGAANAVVAACLEQRCTPVIGNALFNEVEDVFARVSLFESCRLNPRERDELIDAFLSCCEWVRVYYLWRPNLADEADNHLVELGVAAGADFIVSRDLRNLRASQLHFPQLRAVSPEQFLKEL
ncbi:MAG: putative toxin-antitoxin system toxin component, PIN family [Rhodocyclaceae bacterium]|nr:putative toxin-antitoxin system toxin component, PIN family [Rhodocyclaceae bacterium]MBL0074967.1 putative toxin-antitoxin system toxin component, PIN family [Rhodocyclaceae bacterium]MBP6108699.1 putative toxin-antitoxin system toxin component, PIN family [Rhodocyclaceae bacterium]